MLHEDLVKVRFGSISNASCGAVMRQHAHAMSTRQTRSRQQLYLKALYMKRLMDHLIAA